LTTLFSDGFESGDFTEWTYTSGTVEVVTSPIFAGFKAAKATGSGSVWEKDLASGYADLYVLAYVRVPVLPSSGTTLFVLMLYNTDFSEVGRILIYNNAGPCFWLIQTPSGYYGYYDEAVTVDTWYGIELRRLVGDATHGHMTFWLNGVQRIDQTEAITGNSQNLIVGVPYAADEGLVAYGDNYVMADAYIPYIHSAVATGAGLSQASIATALSQAVKGAGASQDAVGVKFSQHVRGAGLGQASIAEKVSQSVKGAGSSQSSILGRVSQVVNGAGASVGAGLVRISHTAHAYGSSVGAGIVRVSQVVHGHGASAATRSAQVSQIVHGYGASAGAGLVRISHTATGHGTSVATSAVHVSQSVRGYGHSVGTHLARLSQVVRGHGSSVAVPSIRTPRAYGSGIYGIGWALRFGGRITARRLRDKYGN
jgi:hypothetical protein